MHAIHWLSQRKVAIAKTAYEAMTEHLYTILKLSKGERDLFVFQNIFRVSPHELRKSNLIEVGDGMHSAAEKLTASLVLASVDTVVLSGYTTFEYGLLAPEALTVAQSAAILASLSQHGISFRETQQFV